MVLFTELGKINDFGKINEFLGKKYQKERKKLPYDVKFFICFAQIIKNHFPRGFYL